ncbi:hypothetical protein N658DRAFT_510599 [Parathielavia hyrcaniae]|uniref:CHAT domain-containing protein n=1 Tax=Parathielavia hyrcaniae TaxID=113614 RepID=A0AAN6PUA9_9PEZI|nr:hypothetical protein N658DRAFT_510599 [Parathielavia hyrcaniae]
MDELNSLNSRLAAVAVSKAPVPDRRVGVIATADRERDLGNYTKALALYREAEVMQADLIISIKIAGTLAEQGRAPIAAQECDQALAKFAHMEGDRVRLAAARLLRAFLASLMDLEFLSALELGREYFDEYVRPHPLAEWKGSKLAICLLLNNLQGTLKLGGADVDPQPWDAATVRGLYEELVRSEDFSAAYKVACFPNSGKPISAVHDMSLVDDLLQQPSLPVLVRAEIMQFKGLLARESGDRDGWFSMSGEAGRIFQSQRHRLGTLSIEKERLLSDELTKLSYDELKSATRRIRDEFIQLGNWAGAKECMMALSTMAFRHADEQLFGQLNEEYEQIYAGCMTKIEWANKENVQLQYWGDRGRHVAKLMATNEELYHAYADADMPFFAANIASTLIQVYKTFGDQRNADQWTLRAAGCTGSTDLMPLPLLHPFMRRAQEAAKGIGLLPVGEETVLLSQFLAEMTARRRSSDSVATVLLSEALCHAPASWDLLVDAYNMRAEAAGILQSVRASGVDLWGVYGNMGRAAEFLWADYFYRTILVLAAEEGFTPSVQFSITNLHDLWLRALTFRNRTNGRYVAGDDVTVLARDQTRSYLRMAKKELDRARRDSSTLSKSAAVMSKMSARATSMATNLYSSAFELAMAIGSPSYLWRWVQDSKARSASDLLALGISVPETLRNAITHSGHTMLLFEEESSIMERLNSAKGTTLVVLRQRLERLRERMEKDELADAILALREARPTTLEALLAVTQTEEEPASSGASVRSSTRIENPDLRRAQPPRRVLFVDYGFHQGKGFIVVTDGNRPNSLWVNVTIQEASRWKEDWLAPRPPDSVMSPAGAAAERYDPFLRDEEDAALGWLSRLANPLLRFSKAGDLLVLCPSETIHGIPIHAAKLRPEAGTGEPLCLIERNPVVYTASMTITQRCMARATSPPDATATGNNSSNKILGVYRHPAPIRDMASRISRNLPPRSLDTHIDTQLDRAVLQDALANSKTVLFFGHCSTGPGSDATNARSPSQHLLLNDNPIRRPDGNDTAFRTPVHASLVSLVACESADQDIRTGDEPLGLLTALLCSGANSVVGTLWSVEPRVGVAFTEEFYKRLMAPHGSREVDVRVEGEEERVKRRRMIDLAVVLQETVVELKRSRRQGFNTVNVMDWGAFTLNGAWLLDALDAPGDQRGH